MAGAIIAAILEHPYELLLLLVELRSLMKTGALEVVEVELDEMDEGGEIDEASDEVDDCCMCLF